MVWGVSIRRKEVYIICLINQLIPSAGHSDMPLSKVTHNTRGELGANVEEVPCSNSERGKSKVDLSFFQTCSQALVS